MSSSGLGASGSISVCDSTDADVAPAENNDNNPANVDVLVDHFKGFACQSDDTTTTTAATTAEETEPKLKWWQTIPKGAEAIVKEIAAERVLVNLLDGRLDGPKSQQPEAEQPEPNQRNKPRLTVNFDAVYRLIYEYPGLCHKTYTFQWDHGDTRCLTPLAMLCCLQAPLRLLEMVYQANPKAISQAEPRKGCLPFHYACTFEASCDVLDFLMERNPLSIRTPRLDGMYPLHLAIYFKAQLRVVEHLHDAWPQALVQCDYDRWTALHAAARGQASLDVVRYLASKNEDNCSATDAKGRTPLHLACRKRGNLPVVDFLIWQAPRTLSMEDGTSSTPLFCAARNQSVPVLEMLLMRQQQALHPPGLVRDNNNNNNNNNNGLSDHVGATLLHYAALENKADVVDFLVSQYPDMVTCRTQDYCRYMPVHLACHFRAPLANIKVLVEHAPHTLHATCRRGRTPLDICRLYKHKQEVVEYLMEQMTCL